MRSKSILREALCGFLFSAMLLTAQPAQAQWTVFDPTSYAQLVRSELKRAQEWAQKVQQYQQMYKNAVDQYTTMRGVLQTVDKQLQKNMQLVHLTNDVGDIIRGSFQLRRRVEGMVRYQIASLQQIDDRLKNGILDPERDLQDFEDYLLYSMGRNSKQTIQLMTRTAKADVMIQGWLKEKQDLEKQRGEAYATLNQLMDRLDAERNNPAPSSLDPLTSSLQQTRQLIASLDDRISQLSEKIQQRSNSYGLRLSDMENFGYTILSTNEAWRELQKTKDEISTTFDGLILGMTP